MAKPQKIKNKNGSFSYRIYVNNSSSGKLIRESKTFSTRQLAIDWADKRLKEIERAAIYGEVSKSTIGDIILKYQENYSKNYGRSKNYDVMRLSKQDIAKVKICELSSKDLIKHCAERNKTVKPQTAINDLIWLRTIISTMSAVDGFDYDPSVFERATIIMKKEKLIGKSKQRTRRPTKKELFRLSKYFGKSKSKIPILHIMWFAIFSARRLSEIIRIEWEDNDNIKKTGMVRDAKHPTQKKGNNRRFKYTKSAWKIVERQPKQGKYIFPYNPKTITKMFTRACCYLNIEDLHFHDLRHEGTSRLFEMGYAIEQVQQFTLHEEWRTLARYTHIKPEDIAWFDDKSDK